MSEYISDATPQQLDELIVLIKELRGFDFTHYSKASFKRRMLRVLQLKRISFFELKHLLINDAEFFQHFLEEITVNVTEMFRDPTFYRALNAEVLPYLTTFQFIKIWSAGCSSGEEAYSLAILMKETGLMKKSFIYGTDVNTQVLQQARKGIYSLRKIKGYAENYKHADMPGTLTDHFTVMYDAATVHNELKQQTLFSVHNLISDGVFNEFQMITCRNVFIYFDIYLQEEILKTFYDSLCNLGFICLGSKEAIRSEFFKKRLKVVNSRENIYQKIG
jgi:chemotaxis protein methyltransferase CheR